ncbi:hypothetical protein A3D71_00415 [Candidatus Kaiserbacteria bacterium RIFCSPHIGHO2_02_FULL_55_20]|uniref:Uncharacterized protein n=1 Tax=Candidatus Kaiserbacteria bacterium RIFCSPHIGHO2_02_FULL_55_20 TaxID=1798497 RepID=A0A1F6DX77_9BACT|nr:MAG: hypothetical protein A2680_04590 [Candidatus Kaiserbacteria bacterium RIFCSPHIGHO2_01_FULL_55_37]OGG66029.1 MAG: hypothetical protein A3D71_00415 [Candidatus Kaiserbacteria bacterium RIFCSPHIGHO2_02_FULL_55_20]
MEILIVREPVSEETLDALAQAWHGTLVKGVADVGRDVVALGGDWHMDANNILIADGSQQENVWGFNIYPKERSDSALEYISLINIRPAQGNKAMELADEALRGKIKEIVSKLVPHLGL